MEKFIFPESMGVVHKTVTVPRKINEQVKQVLEGRKTTFSEFAVAAIEFTLKHLEVK